MSIVTRLSGVVLAAALLLPAPAWAAAKAFAGLSGWDHTVGTTPTPQLPRDQESWKKSDGELVTLLSDGGLSYDDQLAAVKKNVADNGMHPSLDRDRMCDGRRAHEIELPIGDSTVRQVFVDDAPGLTKLTYIRPSKTPVSADVTAAIVAYCGT